MATLKYTALIVVATGIIGLVGYSILNNPTALIEPSGNNFVDIKLDNYPANKKTNPEDKQAQKENDTSKSKENNESPALKVIKTHSNPEGDFEFTYPAELGNVIGEKVGLSTRTDNCENKGFYYQGTFTNNPNIDFGYISADFFDCESNGESLLDIKSFYISDNTLNFNSWNEKAVKNSAHISQIIATADPDISAYVFKNTIDNDAGGKLAVIIQTPNKNIGPLVFRILNNDPTKTLNDKQSLAIFRAIIAD